MTTRDWLRKNGYDNVAAIIDEVNAENRVAGRKTRRNWWDTLAGGEGGKPFTVNGREFPVLRVAQIRQGKPVTENAISLNASEQPPDVVATKRWPRRRMPSKAKRPINKTSHRAATQEKQVS